MKALELYWCAHFEARDIHPRGRRDFDECSQGISARKQSILSHVAQLEANQAWLATTKAIGHLGLASTSSALSLRPHEGVTSPRASGKSPAATISSPSRRILQSLTLSSSSPYTLLHPALYTLRHTSHTLPSLPWYPQRRNYSRFPSFYYPL